MNFDFRTPKTRLPARKTPATATFSESKSISLENNKKRLQIQILSFPSILLSSLKTLVMFVGEMDYTDLQFHHWLGQVIFVLFIFLMIIVLMNILNGLAVSDIHKIQEEVDTYHMISTVETLVSKKAVSRKEKENK